MLPTIRPKQLLLEAKDHIDAGRFPEAEQLCRQVVRADGGNADAHHFLGVVAMRTGRHEDAISEVNEALRLKPARPDYHNTLGAVYAGLKQHAHAIHHFWRALAMEPKNLGAMQNLAKALRAANYPEEAIRVSHDVAALDPTLVADPGMLCEVGRRFQEERQLERAISCYRRAAELNPQNPAPYRLLSAVFEESDQFAEAIEAAQTATRLQPNDPEALKSLGSLYFQIGNRQEALGWFERAVQSDPTFIAGHAALSDAKRYEPGDPHLQQMESLLPTETSSADDQVMLHFALGKAYDDLQQHDRSFEHFRLGNAVRRKEIEYDPNNTENRVSVLIDFFTPERFSEIGDRMACDSTVPVFVLGMPRSGTTLVEQILASHPSVHGAGELNHIKQLVDRLPSMSASGDVFPYCLGSLPPATAREVGGEYVGKLRELGPDAKHVTDKMPWNHFMLGLIALLWPKSKVVHCRRDPLAICLSCFTRNFATGQPFAWDLAELGHYYRQYERLNEHWQRVLPTQVLEVQYEHLVTDTEAHARKLIEFCGLPWDDACLAFHESKRRVKTNPFGARTPVYRDAIDRWRRFEPYLEPLKQALAGEVKPAPGAVR